jgi:hypothetical protein
MWFRFWQEEYLPLILVILEDGVICLHIRADLQLLKIAQSGSYPFSQNRGGISNTG